MPLNCDNAMIAYVQLFDLLTVRQRMRLILISQYDYTIRKLACK